MHIISSPFTCLVDNTPSDVQLRLIDVQSDALLAEHFESVSLLDFYSSVKDNFPHRRRRRSEDVGYLSTYRHTVCEQTFSAMQFNKSRYRFSLTIPTCYTWL